MNTKQKTKSGILLSSLIVVLIAMCALLFGCSDIISPRGAGPAEIPAGYGRVNISFSGGASRTAFPTMDLGNWELEFIFTKVGGVPEIITVVNPDSNFFILEIGAWTVEVNAYLKDGEGRGEKIAWGSSEEPFTVLAGEISDIIVNLVGKDSDGSGTLIFKVETVLPAGIDSLVVNFEQTYLRELPALGANLLQTHAGYAATPYTETLTNLPAGFYLLTVKIEDGARENNRAGYYAGKSVVVHIYNGLTTDYTMTFGEDDYLPSGIHGEYSIINGMVAPVPGEAPITAITPCFEYTGTVSWAPSHSTFQLDQAYTATITITGKPGFTVNGISAGFFSVSGHPGVTNAYNSGVITIEFPALHEVKFININELGGEVPYLTVNVPDGSLVERPDNPNRSNDDRFAGWFMDADCNDEGAILRRWRFNDYPVTGSMSLYARWLTWTYEEIGHDELLDIFQPGGTTPLDLNGDFFLSEDIDLKDYNGPDNKGWVPIGSSEGDADFTNPFMGTFDGNGCIISYLRSERPSEGFIGLFGALRDATVRNLGLELGVGGIQGNNDVGGITGNSKSSIIENCFVKGSISAHGSVGAIAGHIGEGTIVRNCYTMGTVTSESASGDAGGIVGNIIDGGTIENCYSTMTVTANGDTGGILARAGDRGVPVNHHGGDDKYFGLNFPTIIRNCVAINDNISNSTNNGRIVGNIAANKPDPYVPFNSEPDSNNNYRTLEIQNNYARVGLNDFGRGVQHDGTTVSSNALLKQESFYKNIGGPGIGWKFGNNDANPWKIQEDVTYPMLYWE